MNKVYLIWFVGQARQHLFGVCSSRMEAERLRDAYKLHPATRDGWFRPIEEVEIDSPLAMGYWPRTGV